MGCSNHSKAHQEQGAVGPSTMHLTTSASLKTCHNMLLLIL